jgi:hypothetical protein
LKGWQALLAAAKPVTAQLQRAMTDPSNAQLSMLSKIVDTNAKTEFGRRHGFDGISSIDDFRRAVPIQTYANFSDDIDRIARGESDQLTAEPVIAFEETGGTASGHKLIPYTAASLMAFRNAVLPWLDCLASRRPQVTKGRVYASISPATRSPKSTSGGLPIGFESDAAYLGPDLVPAFLSLLAVSPSLGAISNVDQWRLDTLIQLIEAEDLSVISVWSPTFLLELIPAIAPLADVLAPKLEISTRRRFEAALYGGRLDTSILWPMLDTISCWTEGASAPFSSTLQAKFPHCLIDSKGLLATEAAITLPFGFEEGAIPALESCVIEFIDEAGEPHLCDTLQPDVAYRVVITTWGGLYRYDMGDTVRCTKIVDGLPRLRFEGRGSLTSDLVGEKLDDAFVQTVLTPIGVAAALVAQSRPRPHYQLWLDQAPSPAVGELAAIAAQVESGLGKNPQYAYARRMGQLDPVVALHKPGFVLQRIAQKVANGGRLGDTKSVGLITLPVEQGVC